MLKQMLDMQHTMMRNEILEKVILLLRQHKDGSRGSIHQEPWKADFFMIFAEAYNAGMMHGTDGLLTADALTASVTDRAPELAEGQTWEALHRFWSDWTYAWAHAGR